jgi:hypothetical protein
MSGLEKKGRSFKMEKFKELYKEEVFLGEEIVL